MDFKVGERYRVGIDGLEKGDIIEITDVGTVNVEYRTVKFNEFASIRTRWNTFHKTSDFAQSLVKVDIVPSGMIALHQVATYAEIPCYVRRDAVIGVEARYRKVRKESDSILDSQEWEMKAEGSRVHLPTTIMVVRESVEEVIQMLGETYG